MKVFIAGHNGMVGSSLLRLLPSGYTAVTASRKSLDLTDIDSTRDFFRKENPDAVILAAAKVGGIQANTNNQKEFLIENLRIQSSIISAAVENSIRKFIFLGSSCVYPKLASQPIAEDSLLTGPLEPTNEGYALAKITGNRLCKAIFDQDGLDYFSLMPTNLYGPNDNFHPDTSHAPAALMRKFHEAKISGANTVTVWGTGNPKREFLHVDDLARACWHMMNQKVGGELINVGTGVDLQIFDFAKLMARVVGFKGDVVFDASKPDGTPRKLLDVSKIHSYGWTHKIELEEGLNHTYHWFKAALSRGELRGY